MKIVVVGLGYVGTITSYVFAKTGVDVIGVEKDKSKIDLLKSNNPHFYEPGLEDLIQQGSSNLSITNDISTINFSDIDFIFICLGTPSGTDGKLNLTSIYDTVEKLSALESFKSNNNCAVIIRSTIESGTIKNLKTRLELKKLKNEILFHPEFLREGSAIKDFFNPPFIVCSHPKSHLIKSKFETIYKDIGGVIFSETINLELLKLSCNVWHALKVTFANEIGLISESVGADGKEVMDIFCIDDKLNISNAYLKPGFAFGGSCLPKDVSSMSQLAKNLGLSTIPSINKTNQQIINLFAEKILKQNPAEINWIGLTFKENTDDMRDSPYLNCINYITNKSKIIINVYDRHLNSTSKGRNRDIYVTLLNNESINIVNDIEGLNNSLITYSSHSYENLNLKNNFSNLRYL